MTTVAPLLARCPLCGRELVVQDGRIREHLPPDQPWSEKKCPGSGSKVEVSS